MPPISRSTLKGVLFLAIIEHRVLVDRIAALELAMFYCEWAKEEWVEFHWGLHPIGRILNQDAFWEAKDALDQEYRTLDSELWQRHRDLPEVSMVVLTLVAVLGKLSLSENP